MPSAVKNDSYGVNPMEGTAFQLSADPLDDYQRYLFLEVYELMRPSLAQFPHALLSQLSLDRKEYKTNAVFDTQEPVAAGQQGSPDNGSKSKLKQKQSRTHDDPSGRSRQKRSSTLVCNEYIIPDISRNPVTQRTFDPAFQPYLQISPYNILSLEEDATSPREEKVLVPMGQSGNSRDFSPTDLELQTAIDMSNKPGSNITKNQEFRMIKLNAKINQSVIINPNNCVIWDGETGYVFFTGIWRLYQDVMKCLCTTNRQYQQDQSSRMRCCQELQEVLSDVMYGKLNKSSKKESQAKWNKWFQRESFSTYVDLHWHKLDSNLANLLAQSYDPSIQFDSVIKRIRGGYIKIQGTWLPYAVCKELCSRFCYPLRYLLVPVFGADFPEKCEHWYAQRAQQHATPLGSSSLSPQSMSSTSSASYFTDDRDSLNTAQDLLDISRRSSWNEVRHPSIVPQIHLPHRHYRSQSWTGIIEQNKTPDERRKSSDVTLPPIQYLFEDLRKSFLDDSKN